MGHPTTPRTDALFGVFLQDIREIRQKHPKSFGNKYYRFDYAGRTRDEYGLLVEPDDFPKSVKREIMQAFALRLNHDSVAVGSAGERKRKGPNF